MKQVKVDGEGPGALNKVARQIVKEVDGGRRFPGTEITQPYLHLQ